MSRLPALFVPIAVVFGSAVFPMSASAYPTAVALKIAAAAGAAAAISILLLAATPAFLARRSESGGLEDAALWESRCRFEAIDAWTSHFGIFTAASISFAYATLFLPLGPGPRFTAGLLAALAAYPWLLREAHRVAAGPALRSDDYWDWNFIRLRWKRLQPLRRSRLSTEFGLVLERGANLKGARRIAELGAGASVLWELAPREAKAGWILVDASAPAIHYCRTRGIGTQWVCADARQLPFENASLDAVIGHSFFDSIFDRQFDDIMEETRRVLRPGGMLLHIQDFSDWPGPELGPRLAELLKEAGSSGAARFSRFSTALEFRPAAAAELPRLRSALKRLAGDSEGLRQDRLRYLDGVYASISGAGARIDPRQAFIEIFTLSLRRHGFEPLPPRPELRDALRFVAYISARRPGKPPPSP